MNVWLTAEQLQLAKELNEMIDNRANRILELVGTLLGELKYVRRVEIEATTVGISTEGPICYGGWDTDGFSVPTEIFLELDDAKVLQWAREERERRMDARVKAEEEARAKEVEAREAREKAQLAELQKKYGTTPTA